jgi:hypothetical protein
VNTPEVGLQPLCAGSRLAHDTLDESVDGILGKLKVINNAPNRHQDNEHDDGCTPTPKNQYATGGLFVEAQNGTILSREHVIMRCLKPEPGMGRI